MKQILLFILFLLIAWNCSNKNRIILPHLPSSDKTENKLIGYKETVNVSEKDPNILYDSLFQWCISYKDSDYHLIPSASIRQDRENHSFQGRYNIDIIQNSSQKEEIKCTLFIQASNKQFNYLITDFFINSQKTWKQGRLEPYNFKKYDKRKWDYPLTKINRRVNQLIDDLKNHSKKW